MFALSSVAIEEGQATTRALWLKGTPGHLHVVKALEIESEGESSLRQVIARLKRERFPVKALTLAVDGRAASLRYNLVPPVPDWRLELIMKYESEELTAKSGEPMSSDWRQLEVPESNADDLVLLVGLGKDSQLQPRIDEIEAAGGQVNLALPRPLALYHAYRQSVRGVPPETVMLADIGAGETQVVIATEGRLLFARPVNFGGDQIDELIASSLDVKSEHARRLKERIGTDAIPDHLAASAQPALRSAFGQVVSMLRSSATFCKAQTKLPELELDRILLCGGSAALPGLNDYLEEQLQVPVEVFRPRVDGELPGDAGSWATVLGAAASRLDPDKLTLDLLPAPAKARREFRDRTVFLYAAAAILVLAAIIKFAAAFKDGATTSAWQETYGENESLVSGWRRELGSAEQANKKMRGQIQRLREEASNGSFTAELCDRLRVITPREVAVAQIGTQREELDGQVYLTISIEGIADNSDRKGLEQIRALQTALEGMPRVKWVKPEVGEPEGGQYPFTLVVSPDEEIPEDARRRKPGRGGSRRRSL